MAHLSLSLLGPFLVALDGKPVTGFESNKVRALLAYLAAEANRPHRRETLAGLLWPDWPDSAARANLRNALANLRKAIQDRAPYGDRRAIPPFLLITRETIQFNSSSDHWFDVTVFRELVEMDKEAQTAHGLEEAISLYRGSFLEGFSLKDSPVFEDWSLLVREQLHRQALMALHRLTGHYERRGEYERACEYAWRQVELEPWQEEAHQQLMRLLALSGQRSAALAQYETCRRLLAEELGVEPAAETTVLYECIRDGKMEKWGQREIRPHNLPALLTSFVGRETELAEVKGCLRDPDCRLLTLVGPGGIGKTRLALEAAARVEGFDHGVFFVSLAPLQTTDAIVPTVAEAIGFSFYEGGDPRQQLLDFLRQKAMLLVLDNFEHLIDASGLLVRILKSAPQVKILVTSRARLNVRGEHLFPVAGMSFPDDPAAEDARQYSAVWLFLTGARRVRPGFEPTAEDLMDVVRICHLVQGVPLGILLAAAWVPMLTPTEIAAEISQSLDFLGADLRDVPERQRSMRAVFDHSWSLLAEREREILRGVSVFCGGFSRQAAQYVTGARLRDLMALVDKSLLHRTLAGRYELHELVRGYALERLDQSPDSGEKVRERHSAYYVAALQQWAMDSKGPRQRVAFAEIEPEGENVRAAWNWAAKRQRVDHMGLALEGLSLFYRWRGRYQEGEAVCRTAAEELAPAVASLPPASSGELVRVLSRVLTEQSDFDLLLGRTEIADRLLGRVLALLERPELGSQDTRREKALALKLMGMATRWRSADAAETRLLWEQSLALYQALGDRWMTADLLHLLGRLHLDSGAYDEAERLCKEGLEIRRALGDQSGIADSLTLLGLVAWSRGFYDEQERLAREAVAIWQGLGNRSGMADGFRWLSSALLARGEYAQAQSYSEESLAIYDDLGFLSAVASETINLGLAKMHLGQYEGARVLGRESLTLGRTIGTKIDRFALLLLGSVALVEEAYVEAQEMLKRSAALYGDEEMGWIPAILAYAARGAGQSSEAGEHLFHALQMATEIGAFLPLVYALPAMALLLADQGEQQRAIEVYQLASRYPLVAKSRWFEDIVGRHIADVAAALPPEVVAAAQERGRSRNLEISVKELLTELGG